MVLLLVTLAAAQFGGVTFSTVIDSISTFFAGLGSGDGYPYQLNGITIDDGDITNSDLTALRFLTLLQKNFQALPILMTTL